VLPINKAVKFLQGDIDEVSALRGGYTDEERNWLRYVVAVIAARNNDAKKAEMLLQSVLLTTGHDTWYRLIAECISDHQKEKSLAEKAGESPEYVLTGHVAMGFWAEGSGDKSKAMNHYREALGSYMDDMIEYAFAVERIKRLRQRER
jgi:hypothetical protein